MAYPDVYYRKRRANGEEIAGKNLLGRAGAGKYLPLPRRIVYGVTATMLILVAARIVLRLVGAEDHAIGVLVDGLTDPYVWVFNSLFSGTPRLLLAEVEPGSIISLIFFPLLAIAVLGLIDEIRSGKYRRISRTK